MRQSRGFMDFALFIHSAQYAEYHYCALPRFCLPTDHAKAYPAAALLRLAALSITICIPFCTKGIILKFNMIFGNKPINKR